MDSSEELSSRLGVAPLTELSSRLAEVLDIVRDDLGLSGIAVAVESRGWAQVEIIRSFPDVIRRGDLLVLPKRGKGEVENSVVAQGKSATSHLKSHFYFKSIETSQFSLGPIHYGCVIPVETGILRRYILLFSHAPLSVAEETVLRYGVIVSKFVEFAVSANATVEQLRQRADSAEFVASSDPLTGALSRHGFSEAVRREQARLDRDPAPISVVVMDLDGLKMINDSMGHDAGDRYIRRFAEVLQSTCRTADYVARLGGDEFVILAPDADDAAVQLLMSRLSRALIYSGVSASMGSASDMDRSLTIYDLMTVADAQMYQAKRRKQEHAVKPAIRHA